MDEGKIAAGASMRNGQAIRDYTQSAEYLHAAYRHRLGLIIPIIGITIGLALLAYPIVTDWYASQMANDIITATSAYNDQEMNDPHRFYYKEQAEAYNAYLSDHQMTMDETDELLGYDQQLAYKDPDVMSWVEIPSIQVKLPVYHGVSDDVLAVGIGHVPETSLPVGGKSSHCVLSGHSALPTARMFDDIRLMKEGDLFFLHTLGDTYAYRVYGTDVIEPEDTDSLYIQPDRDLCTLVTCTPYGVNTHRLLVRGERYDYSPEDLPQPFFLQSYVNIRTIPFLIAVAWLLFNGCAWFVFRSIHWRHKVAQIKAKYEAEHGKSE